MKRFGKLLSVGLALSLAAAANAQVHPSLQRGFAAEKAFQIGDVDHVNLFNGNLVLTVPIGQEYSTGGGFAYRLMLHYNGNIWDYNDQVQTGRVAYTRAEPMHTSNAGFGWLLTLGELLAPLNPGNETEGNLSYLAPDGSQHAFYPSLHQGDTNIGGRQFTRDGTYIRLSGLFENGTRIDLEFPNGEIHTFRDTGAKSYRLDKIVDRFGNFLMITDLGDSWKLHDNYGRDHTVVFEAAQTMPTGLFPRRVKSIALAGPQGTQAIWNFQYQNTRLSRGCPDRDPQTGDVTVPLLSRIVQPDGSFWDLPVASSYNVVQNVACSDYSGRIKEITLPTGGKISWTWRFWPKERPAPCVVSEKRNWLQSPFGVATRTVSSGQVVGTWTYRPELLPRTILCEAPRSQITKVTNPLGQVEQHYFSAYRFGDPEPEAWRKTEFGLPFTRFETDGAGRYLSTRIYETCDPDLVQPCMPERTTYVRYDQDLAPPSDGQGSGFNINSRVASERTFYDSDGGKYADEDSSGFDGFGHYRTRQLNGNFPGDNAKTLFTNYNPESGVYLPGGGGNFRMRGPFEPWVLGTYTEQTVSQASNKYKVQTCFERDGSGLAITPFLLRQRAYLDKFGTTPNSRDLVRVYARDGEGNVLGEDDYGGDRQPLATSADLCSAPLSDPPFGMAFLPVSKNQWHRTAAYTEAGGVGTLPFLSVDETVDPSTGQIVSSTDATGFQTNFTYDVMGRLTKVQPAQDSQTQYIYTLPTGAAPNATPQVQILRKSNAGTSTLAESGFLFDGLGRVWQEKQRIAGQGLQLRETKYDAMGHIASASELGSPNHVTEYRDYDPFGRARLIVSPDGHQTQMFFGGDRSVTRKVSIGTTWNGSTVVEQTSTVDELHDRFGRLHTLSEPSGAGGAAITTTYTYDAGDRMLKAATTAAGVTQQRLFDYDHRGFLLSETHPEKSAAVTYDQFDAHGHAWHRVDGSNDLSFSFDRADRLLEIREKFQTSTRQLKLFTYAKPGDSCGYCLSKLWKASRFNYVTVGSPVTVEIRETTSYGGLEGRASTRKTENFVGVAPTTPNEAFTFSQTYDALGHVATATYPTCSHAACTNRPVRTVTNSFTDGFLTSVMGVAGPVTSNYATSISYQLNGMVRQVVHGNSPTVTVTDTVGLDPDGMSRPASFSTARGTTQLWDTSTYSYDGAGNIKRIGPSWFTYDLVSRLSATSLNVNQGVAAPTFVSQSYVYDAFGNIQSIATNGPVTNTPTTSATNRLASPAAYDGAGNLTLWLGNQYEPDGLNMIRRYKTAGGEEWTSLYDADDERVWTYKTGGTDSRWYLRGFDAKVLREYNATAAWQVANDYIYRNGQLLASETPSGVRHFHLDHLGTPRLITDGSGQKKSFHVYYPFGQEATSQGQDAERMKFTGHERDLGNPAGDGDDLDYMHARFFSPVTGRFLSTDPILDLKRVAKSSQAWNRYGYVESNPLRYKDPHGTCVDGCILEAIGLAVAAVAESPVGQEAIAAGEAEVSAVSQEAIAGVEEAVVSAKTLAQRLAENVQAGKIGERLAGIGDAAKKAIDSITRTATRRLPDAIDDASDTLIEVKNYSSGVVRLTNQLRDFVAYSQQKGYTFVLYVKNPEMISADLQALVTEGLISLKKLPPPVP